VQPRSRQFESYGVAAPAAVVGTQQSFDLGAKTGEEHGLSGGTPVPLAVVKRKARDTRVRPGAGVLEPRVPDGRGAEAESGGTAADNGSQSVAVPLAQRMALSVEEAGALLGISRDLAYDLVASRQLPSVRLGRRLVVPRRALEEALERLLEAG
jgi:excisionase family DNA binding protein